MNKDSKTLVTGAKGLLGSALNRRLWNDSYLVSGVSNKGSPIFVDLRHKSSVEYLFGELNPEYVFHCAAKVGGIKSNIDSPAEFIRDNLLMQTNVIDAAYRHGVKKLIFVASGCIYPPSAEIPYKENDLLSGKLEESNEFYAIAKLAGIKMCQAYHKQYGFDAISALPCNIYGPFDSFNLQTGHLVPSLIRKFYEAKRDGLKIVEIWGTGHSMRELIHVDDVASAMIFLMEQETKHDVVNIGSGDEISVRGLAEMIWTISGYNGEVFFNGKMDGVFRKPLDRSVLTEMGWTPKKKLIDGLKETYDWYSENESVARK